MLAFISVRFNDIKKDSRFTSFKTLLKFSLACVPFVLFAYLYFDQRIIFDYLTNIQVIRYLSGIGIYVPELSVWACVAYLVVFVLLKDSKVSYFSFSSFVVLAPFLTAMQISLDPKSNIQNLQTHAVFCFTIISGILLHSMFKTYWLRVYTDELTRIPNRRALDEQLTGLSGSYTLAMIDTDHF